MTASAFEALRAQHAADRDAALPQLVAQLEWSAAALRREREHRLRTLLATARARSPWHRDRLRHVDPDRFTEADLPSLPVMTKADLMDNFDAVVTDPKLTRAVVDAHVENLPENLYLFDRYLVAASGGSSGRRGVFVYDQDAYVTFNCSIVRWRMRAEPPKPPMANLWAGRGAHVSYLGFRVFPPPLAMESIAPTTPLATLVGRLNTVQPKTLAAYASTLALLASEARAGRLRIDVEAVMTCGEPLFPEVRAEIEAVWPVHVENYYGMSEGLYAFPCHAGDAMHVPDDLHCLEPVDETGKPVALGSPAAKFYLTNLFNWTQPLIRYEVTDQLVMLADPCPCGCAHRRVDQVLGRTDDVFVYPDGVHVHPLAIRGPLGRSQSVAEYQVMQTARGVDIRLCADGTIDATALGHAVAESLEASGLRDPVVTVEVVPELPRLGSGKLKRFVPLAVS